jgi:hypothetical protein
MLYVNNRDGFTIAVSENRQLARIAQSTVLSNNAFSVMVPVLDQLLDWRTGQIRALLESNGQSWWRMYWCSPPQPGPCFAGPRPSDAMLA